MGNSILWFVVGIFILSYAILLIFPAIRFWRKPILSIDQPSESPITSVVIPVRNERSSIAGCIDAVSRQQHPSGELLSTEIILVDDHSDDDTGEIIRDKSKTTFLQLLQLPSGVEGKKAAITAGVNQAKENWVVTTDADAVPLPLWLWTMHCEQQRSNSLLVAGPILPTGSFGILLALQQIEACILQAISAGLMEKNIALTSSGANLYYHRDLLEKTGGYAADQTPSGDDVLLLLRTSRLFPGKISWAHRYEAIVAVEAAQNLRQIIAQRIRWSSKFRFYQSPLIRTIGFSVAGTVGVIWITILLSSIGWCSWEVPIAAISGKLLVDFIILALTVSFFKKRTLLIWFWPVSFFYLAFMPIIATGAFLGRFSWKGRTYKT
jgi:cellulose synthase/poly-beta-1,6-N-acetylglucosamine synthase-like glycosyltransferase